MAGGGSNGHTDLNFFGLIQNFQCHAIMIVIAVKKKKRKKDEEEEGKKKKN